jgi:hypothetical protein
VLAADKNDSVGMDRVNDTVLTIDMIDELTYSRTEQQLEQFALIRTHNLLKDEVI